MPLTTWPIAFPADVNPSPIGSVEVAETQLESDAEMMRAAIVKIFL